MSIAPKTAPKNPLADVTDEAVEELMVELAAAAVVAHKKASRLSEILEKCRPMIEANRSRGSSWPYIAMLINNKLKTRIHHATIRSYIVPKKSKMSVADINLGAVDLSMMQEGAPLS